MFYFGLLLAFAFVLLAIELGGSWLLFYNPPSLMLVLGCSLALILASYGGKGFGLLFRAPFSRKLTPDEIQRSIEVYKDFKVYLIASGILGVFIGAILILANLRDPAALGPNLAVTLITAFYGIFFAYFICHPVIAKLSEKPKSS
jgi:flagellar motor component MotA